MALPVAKYPAASFAGNEQDIVNDVPQSDPDVLKTANADDYNQATTEIVAVEADLRAAFISESAADIAAMIAAMRADIDAAGGAPVFAFSSFAGTTTPAASEFPINAAATGAVDTNNNALQHNQFTDASEQGVVLLPFRVPLGVTSVKIGMVSRAETAPGGAETVRAKLYTRSIPDDAAVPAFSSGVLMAPFDIPTNENWQYDDETFTLAALGLVAGRCAQIEITRVPSDGSDTLTGSWNLLETNLEFS